MPQNLYFFLLTSFENCPHLKILIIINDDMVYSGSITKCAFNKKWDMMQGQFFYKAFFKDFTIWLNSISLVLRPSKCILSSLLAIALYLSLLPPLVVPIKTLTPPAWLEASILPTISEGTSCAELLGVNWLSINKTI